MSHGYGQFHCTHETDDITKDVKIRFGISNYELDRLLPRVKNEKVIGLIKDELGRKIMIYWITLSTPLS